MGSSIQIFEPWKYQKQFPVNLYYFCLDLWAILRKPDHCEQFLNDHVTNRLKNHLNSELKCSIFRWLLIFLMWSPLKRRHLFNHLQWSLSTIRQSAKLILVQIWIGILWFLVLQPLILSLVRIWIPVHRGLTICWIDTAEYNTVYSDD